MSPHDAPVRHDPAGDGHPYAPSPDQRIPVRPQAGEPFAIGAIADERVAALSCQVVPDEGEARTVALVRGAAAGVDVAAFAGGDGHLAEAQAARAGEAGAWHALLDALPAGVPHRYRLEARLADGSAWTGPWHAVSAGEWVAGGGSLTVGGVPAGEHPRVVPGSVQWWRDAQGVHRVRFAFRLAPAEHVVGFGERFDAVDQRGRTPDAVVFEQYKSQGRFGRTYLPMPFAHVVGGDGWGFHVRTSRRTWFDVGAATADRLVVEAALDGSSAPALDVAVWEGSVSQVLDAFLAEAGRPEELPEWVFDLWASGNEWNTQAIVTQRMDAHRDLGIPVGVVVVEAWSDELGITIFRDARYRVDGGPHRAADFTYPPDGAWPDPKAWVEDMHARGIKVVLWQIPLLKTDETIARDDTAWQPDRTRQVLAEGEALVRSGHVIREAAGRPYRNRGWWFPRALMPDLSTAQGREWWTSYRRYLVEDLDVDGFKTDGGEHAWGDDLRYADGRRGDEGNNLNPVHYARAFGDLLRSAGKAPVTFSRAGFTGSQAHGAYWAGDEDSTWDAFRWTLHAGITAAACGIVYWGWDIAGFSGPVPDAELYLRATAAATFMPLMQYHSEFNHHRPPLRDRTPWNVAELAGDPSVVDVFRRYAHLRTRLRPYLAEQARLAVATSRPLLRGLFVDHPHDEAVWAHPREFQLGDDVLVNPVTSPGAETWETYLPEGEWVDAWAGTAHAGGRVVARDVPRDVIPVYLRAARADDLGRVLRG